MAIYTVKLSDYTGIKMINIFNSGRVARIVLLFTSLSVFNIAFAVSFTGSSVPGE